MSSPPTKGSAVVSIDICLSIVVALLLACDVAVVFAASAALALHPRLLHTGLKPHSTSSLAPALVA